MRKHFPPTSYTWPHPPLWYEVVLTIGSQWRLNHNKIQTISTWLNHLNTPSILSSSPFFTLHNSLICAFGTLSILQIPSNPPRLFVCTVLILNISSSFHNIFSLPYKSSYKQCFMQYSSCKSLALTWDLMAPTTLLPLATFLLHSASSVPD